MKLKIRSILGTFAFAWVAVATETATTTASHDALRELKSDEAFCAKIGGCKKCIGKKGKGRCGWQKADGQRHCVPEVVCDDEAQNCAKASDVEGFPGNNLNKPAGTKDAIKETCKLVNKGNYVAPTPDPTPAPTVSPTLFPTTWTTGYTTTPYPTSSPPTPSPSAAPTEMPPTPSPSISISAAPTETPPTPSPSISAAPTETPPTPSPSISAAPTESPPTPSPSISAAPTGVCEDTDERFLVQDLFDGYVDPELDIGWVHTLTFPGTSYTCDSIGYSRWYYIRRCNKYWKLRELCPQQCCQLCGKSPDSSVPSSDYGDVINLHYPRCDETKRPTPAPTVTFAPTVTPQPTLAPVPTFAPVPRPTRIPDDDCAD